MVDRVDLTSIILYVADALVLVAIFLALGPSVTQPGLGLTIAFFVILSITFVYPAYWALDIRKALAIPLYRRQALGIALMCLAYIVAGFEPTGTAYGFFTLLVFYWIDTSFSAARRSDPLVRDSLHWSKVRIPLWIINGVGIVGGELAFLSGMSGISASSFAGSLLALPFFIVPGSGVALAIVVNRRTKDSALKGQIVWLAGFLLAQFASILVAQVNSLSGFVYFIGFEFAGFSLYKSARSLAPLNRMPIETSRIPSSAVSLIPQQPT